MDELKKATASGPGGTYEARIRLDQAHAPQLHGSGDYNWSVALVDLNPYRRIGPEAAARRLHYTRVGP